MHRYLILSTSTKNFCITEILSYVFVICFFFFQAEDGIRDRTVTGVQTCAIPICVSEFDLRDAFRWSPDGSKIAYWRFDMTGLGTFYLINDTDSLYPKVTPIQYPKAGTKNSAATAGVVSADGGLTTWLQIPDDPRENYLPRM